MKDYTKGSLVFRCLALAAVLALAFYPAHPSAAGQSLPVEAPNEPHSSPSVASFAGWHLPVPAGTWLISRGPCGAGGLFTHQCGYYEDSCAIDLTPLTDSMLGVPVLAPQAGQVFFLGTRSDSGLVVMLQHADGRVSVLMHLSKIVVGLDQRVAQGQVVAYAGNSGSSTRPHLHFHVQPNTVERACLPLDGLDEIDKVRMTVRSFNLAWPALTLPNPPERLPTWLAISANSVPATAPRLVLSPTTLSRLPVAISDARLGNQKVYFQGSALTPTLKLQGQTVFEVPLTGPAVSGEYQAPLRLQTAPNTRAATTLTVTYSVRPPAEASAAQGLIWINPTFVSPANWSPLTQTPKLCFSEFRSAGAAPLSFRVMVVGPTAADSGWQSQMCWTPPALPKGTYYWKVFVRDANGYMNRTNQRPFAFQIR